MFYVMRGNGAVIDRTTTLQAAIDSARAEVDGNPGMYLYINSNSLDELDHVKVVSHHALHNTVQTVVVPHGRPTRD